VPVAWRSSRPSPTGVPAWQGVTLPRAGEGSESSRTQVGGPAERRIPDGLDPGRLGGRGMSVKVQLGGGSLERRSGALSAVAIASTVSAAANPSTQNTRHSPRRALEGRKLQTVHDGRTDGQKGGWNEAPGVHGSLGRVGQEVRRPHSRISRARRGAACNYHPAYVALNARCSSGCWHPFIRNYLFPIRWTTAPVPCM
jgi:hypothetical protein